jgi:DUF3089 family protein
MRTFLKLVAAVVVLLVVAAAAIYYTGNVLTVLAFIGEPRHGWDPALKAPPPDYANDSSWAALPGKPSLADLVPAGVAASPKEKQVDVFFIHPTGYLHGADWNSPLDPNSKTEENTKWMMANQASAFNGCCAIYAPRYREATIFVYVARPSTDLYNKAMDLAYGDVDRAFTYFLEHYSRGRPFIIASHSQGTYHAFRLIRERIDGTPLASRMIAAYTLGGSITDKDVAGLKTVHACASETDLHCIVHWRTYGEGATLPPDAIGKTLCTNPLTWQRDGSRAPASLHKGGVPPSGRFQIDSLFPDVARGIVFAPLKAPVKAWTTAECRGGLLFVADQKGGQFDGADLGGKNYHGLDYPLFAMDIRENAEARVGAYLAADGTATAPAH